MKYLIYKVTFPNQKLYIGMTGTTLNIRKSEHYSHMRNKCRTRFHKALRKYQGRENWEIVYQTNCLDDLREKECYFINYFKSTDIQFGYNLTSGGEGINGYQFTEKQNQQNSHRVKLYFEQHPEHKEKIVKKLKEYHERNPEMRKIHARKQFDQPGYKQYFSEKLKESYKKNGFNSGKAKISIILENINTNERFSFPSLNEAARSLNLSASSVRGLNSGKLKTIRGFRVIKET